MMTANRLKGRGEEHAEGKEVGPLSVRLGLSAKS